jgi:type I restriction enzyme S subunit
LNKDIDSEYFYYLLTSPYVQKQFQSLAAGAVVKNISGDLVKKTVLPIPSLSQQKKLAEIFSEKQAVLKRLSEVYSEKVYELSMLKQSILKQAFNGELVKE